MSLAKFHKKLFARSSQPREELLTALATKATLLDYLAQNSLVGASIGNYNQPISEQDYTEIPYGLGKRLYEGLDINYAEAAEPLRWAGIFITLLQQDLVKHHYLVFNPARKENGTERLERVNLLREGSDGKGYEKELMELAKHFWRRLSGDPTLRGTRDLFSYCPLATAWWKYNSVADATEEWQQQAFACLDQQAWASFVERVVSRITVVDNHTIRTGILLFATANKTNASLIRTPKFWQTIATHQSTLTTMPTPHQIKEFLETTLT